MGLLATRSSVALVRANSSFLLTRVLDGVKNGTTDIRQSEVKNTHLIMTLWLKKTNNNNKNIKI